MWTAKVTTFSEQNLSHRLENEYRYILYKNDEIAEQMTKNVTKRNGFPWKPLPV